MLGEAERDSEKGSSRERDTLESLSHEKLGVKGLERAGARATYTAPWPSLPSASADRGEGSVVRNHTNALASVTTPCALGLVSFVCFSVVAFFSFFVLLHFVLPVRILEGGKVVIISSKSPIIYL